MATSHTRRWPSSVWHRWYTETPTGLKRFDVLAYFGALLPNAIPDYLYFVAYRSHTTTPALLVGILVAPFLSLFAIATILGKKKKESLDAQQKKDYGAGVQLAYGQWRDSAGLFQGALAQTYRHLDIPSAEGTPTTWQSAVTQHLHVIALIIREVFGEETCGRALSVSLALPAADGETLRTELFQSETPGRTPGRVIPLKATDAGAAAAFRKRQAQYIANTQDRRHRAQFSGRPYKSFMSWPVLSGDSKTVLAIVSVDSQHVNGFDKDSEESRRDQVEWMCHPVLQGIAICLLAGRTRSE
ncbi:hypothetical protein GCM10008939_06790 [Deinococcus aquiradiocola]|uniref:GAF domain-containing protein n=1 Tax=Deinococcus aquiradiocola TaxID=393059 RepID=A0A917P7T8_9DEIO|nr:hypothetical protein GCM10008939_06790 [Deinococcus aquiradiocola]